MKVGFTPLFIGYIQLAVLPGYCRYPRLLRLFISSGDRDPSACPVLLIFIKSFRLESIESTS
jgi:hypothetical protein